MTSGGFPLAMPSRKLTLTDAVGNHKASALRNLSRRQASHNLQGQWMAGFRAHRTPRPQWIATTSDRLAICVSNKASNVDALAAHAGANTGQHRQLPNSAHGGTAVYCGSANLEACEQTEGWCLQFPPTAETRTKSQCNLGQATPNRLDAPRRMGSQSSAPKASKRDLYASRTDGVRPGIWVR